MTRGSDTLPCLPASQARLKTLAIRPHDHPARRPAQEGRADQRRNHVMARRIVHAPESRGLGGRQSKTRHLDEFAADAVDEGVVLHGVLFVSPAGVPGGLYLPTIVRSKRYATRHRECESGNLGGLSRESQDPGTGAGLGRPNDRVHERCLFGLFLRYCSCQLASDSVPSTARRQPRARLDVAARLATA